MNLAPSYYAPVENKTAIVTGASSGIGRAIALQLAREGAHIFLTARNATRLEETARAIRNEGGRASVNAFDLFKSDSLRDFVASAAKETGHLEILVNAAGVDHPGTIADGAITEWRDMFEINVLAMPRRCFSPQLSERSRRVNLPPGLIAQD